ncbi:hypothetical protein P3T18_001446 [Paraburkholderia sp. GAS199]
MGAAEIFLTASDADSAPKKLVAKSQQGLLDVVYNDVEHLRGRANQDVAPKQIVRGVIGEDCRHCCQRGRPRHLPRFAAEQRRAGQTHVELVLLQKVCALFPDALRIAGIVVVAKNQNQVGRIAVFRRAPVALRQNF